MKKALVLGATGGMGWALVQELTARGIEVIAFARTIEKLNNMFGGNSLVQLYAGNAYYLEDIVQAAQGVEVIFHCVSVPYPEWQKGHPAIMGNVLNAASQVQAKVVIVDNIYAYGRSRQELVTEEHPKATQTKKGKIRLNMEQLAQEAHQAGTPTLIAHFPDFYGPNAENTMLGTTIKPMVLHKFSSFVGNLQVKREYIYTPDGAKALVELAVRRKHLLF